MNILIFGGTRFMGKTLLEKLVSENHKLVCISRKKNAYHKNLTTIVADRDLGLKLVHNKNFDLIIDFIGFEASSVFSTMESFKKAHYILISSSWVSQYENKIRSFFPYEEKYIYGKLQAERVLRKDFLDGYKRSVIRLPITLGKEDHSQRFNYYLWRIIEKRPIICIQNHLQETQITYKEDVVDAILKFVSNKALKKDFIYEGIPRENISQETLIKKIGIAIKVEHKTSYYSESYLKKFFPEMLTLNPFYREKNYIEIYPNLFEFSDISCKKYDEWISELALINKSIFLSLEYKDKYSKNWYLKKFLNQELKTCE